MIAALIVSIGLSISPTAGGVLQADGLSPNCWYFRVRENRGNPQEIAEKVLGRKVRVLKVEKVEGKGVYIYYCDERRGR